MLTIPENMFVILEKVHDIEKNVHGFEKMFKISKICSLVKKNVHSFDKIFMIK